MNPMRALRQYQKVNSHAQISEASPHRLIQMLMEGGRVAGGVSGPGFARWPENLTQARNCPHHVARQGRVL